jgi:hypothetical protein
MFPMPPRQQMGDGMGSRAASGVARAGRRAGWLAGGSDPAWLSGRRAGGML